MKIDAVIDAVPQIAAGRFTLRAVRRSDAGLVAMHTGADRKSVV